MHDTERKPETKPALGGWTGWLLQRLRATRRREPRLQLLERITLAPRQSLALVEADGRRLLVATSADGGPAFYALDRRTAGLDRRRAGVDGRKAGAAESSARETVQRAARVSW
ncbi:MAG: flagellar biosynthetic protein FliO [Terracidiphilus sp.]